MIKSASLLLATVFASWLAPPPALGQTPPDTLRELCIARPGKDTPPCIVDKGHVVLEFGALGYAADRAPRASEYSFGEILARFGITDMAELQIGFTPFAIVRPAASAAGRGQTLRGAGDVTAALKLGLLRPDGGGVSVAGQAFVTAPTGRDGIGAGAWEGGLIIPIGVELTDGLALTVDPEVDVRGNAAGYGHHLAYAGVVSLGHDLGGGFDGSAEIWSMVDRDPAGSTTRASFDLALAWTPPSRPNLQFDTEIDLGVTSATPAVELKAGIAYRF